MRLVFTAAGSAAAVCDGAERNHVLRGRRWTLSTDGERPYTPFARRVRAPAASDRIPSGLFLQRFLSSDVPVQ